MRLQVFHDFDTIHFLTAVIVKLNRLNIAKSNYCFEIIVYSSVKVFPAQTQRQLACSCTSSWGDDNKATKIGTEPASTTFLVCEDVPEAILVKAQAASNYMDKNIKLLVYGVLQIKDIGGM